MDEKPALLQRAHMTIVYLGACLLLAESSRTLLSWLRSYQWPRRQSRTPIQNTTGTNSVALLIDAENITSFQVEQLVEFALSEAKKLGEVSIRRAYGNCFLFNGNNSWNDTCLHLEFEQVHLTKPTTGKNAADITMAVDAIALAVEGTCNRFCIVTSDSDFTPLVHRLRLLKCQVLGIGEKKTPKTLTRVCNWFVFIDHLMDTTAPAASKQQRPAPRKQVSPSPMPAAPTYEPANGNQPAPAASPSSQQAASAPAESEAKPSDSPAITILREAYLDAAHGQIGDWVLLSRLGLSLRRLHPGFKASDYAADLSALIRQYPGVFEFGKKANGHPQMRLKV